MKDVHTEHCCSLHGCKYGDSDCTVKVKGFPQSYPCEWCDDEPTVVGYVVMRKTVNNKYELSRWIANTSDEQEAQDWVDYYNSFRGKAMYRLGKIVVCEETE